MRLLVLLSALWLSAAAFAQEAAEADGDSAQAFVASLNFQDGDVALPAAKATLKLPPSFRYLSATDTERVLTELWGNPPGSESIGMLVPSAISLADADQSWAIVLQYDNDGYVSDEDAKDIDYGEMLTDMQADAKASNKERKKQGFGSVELLGWAESPRYDSAAHKLHWAKELAFEGSEQHTLNYDVRVLGRNGVLIMRAVAGIEQLSAIKPGMADAIGAVEFDQGARYADFNPTSDRVAEYGLAALVAGGVAAKTGLLTKLLALLIAAKKLVIGGVVLIGAGISKLFGKDKGASRS
jgi:uncharacterized membrane-anchored protein